MRPAPLKILLFLTNYLIILKFNTNMNQVCLIYERIESDKPKVDCRNEKMGLRSSNQNILNRKNVPEPTTFPMKRIQS